MPAGPGPRDRTLARSLRELRRRRRSGRPTSCAVTRRPRRSCRAGVGGLEAWCLDPRSAPRACLCRKVAAGLSMVTNENGPNVVLRPGTALTDMTFDANARRAPLAPSVRVGLGRSGRAEAWAEAWVPVVRAEAGLAPDRDPGLAVGVVGWEWPLTRLRRVTRHGHRLPAVPRTKRQDVAFPVPELAGPMRHRHGCSRGWIPARSAQPAPSGNRVMRSRKRSMSRGSPARSMPRGSRGRSFGGAIK